MRRCCVLVALVLGFAASCSASARAPDSGIAGRVVAGPTCPVETVPPKPECAPRPLVATLRIRRVGSRAPAKSVRSRANGRFRIRLSPATYIVRALPQADLPLPRPPAARRVHVDPGRFASVTITYDSGIR